MYDINNKKEAVREVQRYLEGIGYIENPPSPNGNWDDRTREGVLAVQKAKGLSESGEVNLETMNALYAEFLSYADKSRAKKRAGDAISFPVLRGNSGRGIGEINESLAFLMDYYGEGHRIRRSSYFGEASETAVRILQGIYGMDKTSELDEALYLRIYEDIDSIERLRNIVKT